MAGGEGRELWLICKINFKKSEKRKLYRNDVLNMIKVLHEKICVLTVSFFCVCLQFQKYFILTLRASVQKILKLKCNSNKIVKS